LIKEIISIYRYINLKYKNMKIEVTIVIVLVVKADFRMSLD